MIFLEAGSERPYILLACRPCHIKIKDENEIRNYKREESSIELSSPYCESHHSYASEI